MYSWMVRRKRRFGKRKTKIQKTSRFSKKQKVVLPTLRKGPKTPVDGKIMPKTLAMPREPMSNQRVRGS